MTAVQKDVVSSTAAPLAPTKGNQSPAELFQLDGSGCLTTHVVGASSVSGERPLFPIHGNIGLVPDVYVGVNYNLSQRFGVSSVLAKLRLALHRHSKDTDNNHRPSLLPSHMELTRIQGPFQSNPEASCVSAKWFWSNHHWCKVLCRDNGLIRSEVSMLTLPRLRCELGVSNRQSLSNKDNSGETESTTETNGWSLPDLRVDAFGQMEARQRLSFAPYKCLVSLRRKWDWNQRQEATLLKVTASDGATTVRLDAQLERPRQSALFTVRHDVTYRGRV